MILTLITLSVGIVVQTVFLLAAFWIMIKLQKLEYQFPGLLASAAFVGALDEILNHFLIPYFGIFLASSIATPIVVVASYFCIAKVTHAELVDVFFTVIVGRALWFGMNLWLIGGLMGNLRPTAAEDNGNLSVAEQRKEITEGAPMEAWTNRAPPPPPAAAVINSSTNAVKTNAVKTIPIAPAQGTSAEEIGNHLSIKGVMRNGSRSAITLQYGTRTYALFLGDSLIMQTESGPVAVRLKALGDDGVVLVIKGVEIKRPFHAP